MTLELVRERVGSVEGVQQALVELWRINAPGLKGRRLDEFGFSVTSQTDEDGILLYIFTIVGTTNRRVVEICAGNGMECNAANLVLSHGWHALLIDGDPLLVDIGKAFYSRSRRTRWFPPTFVNAWVTRESINELISGNGFVGEIDLLSLDLDGVDYWIWKAITVVNPRVVVLEYNDILGPDRAWTVPYSDNFVSRSYSTTNGVPLFCGASLRAFTNLAREKGYRLVGANRLGFNAFFLRNDVGVDHFHEVAVESCFSHPKTAEDIRERFPLVADMPWEAM